MLELGTLAAGEGAFTGSAVATLEEAMVGRAAPSGLAGFASHAQHTSRAPVTKPSRLHAHLELQGGRTMAAAYHTAS